MDTLLLKGKTGALEYSNAPSFFIFLQLKMSSS